MGNEVKTKMKLYTRAKMTSKPHQIWWFLKWSTAESELEDAAALATGFPRRLGSASHWGRGAAWPPPAFAEGPRSHGPENMASALVYGA